MFITVIALISTHRKSQRTHSDVSYHDLCNVNDQPVLCKVSQCCIMQGVKVLHDCGRAHMNLKPPRIQVKQDAANATYHCTITDLASAMSTLLAEACVCLLLRLLASSAAVHAKYCKLDHNTLPASKAFSIYSVCMG